MINFWSIVKLTVTLAIRSHLFQLLLGVLLLVVFVLPNTISGDGTAQGFIQISLKYNLATVGFILSVSTIWLSCYTMNNDIDGHQLHLIFTKAIPRWKVWVGKFTGVLLIHVLMLGISTAAIYGQVMWKFEHSDYTEREKVRLTNEVLVGRRSYFPQLVDIDKAVEKRNAEIMKNLQYKYGENADRMAKSTERSTRKKIISSISRVEFGPTMAREWTISGLPVDSSEPIYLRYRAYVDNLYSTTGNQKQTAGLWGAQLTKEDGKDSNGEMTYKSYFRNVSNRPMPFIGGAFHEVRLPGIIVDRTGDARLRYINFDMMRKEQFFQPKDGPLLLIKVVGFFNNYMRAVGVLFVWLTFIAALSCFCATFTSLFSALFLSSAYLIIGLLVSFAFANSDSFFMTIMAVLFINPEGFDVSTLMADGRLIEYTLIFKHFILGTFIFKAVPFITLGIMIYNKREIGLVVKK